MLLNQQMIYARVQKRSGVYCNDHGSRALSSSLSPLYCTVLYCAAVAVARERWGLYHVLHSFDTPSEKLTCVVNIESSILTMFLKIEGSALSKSEFNPSL